MARWSVPLGLLAVAGLIAPFTAALSKSNLYPDISLGAFVLESDPNGMLMSAEVTLQTPIVFYDKTYTSIFVSTEIVPEVSSASACSMYRASSRAF